ncbi:ABC transporter ATP-binding protein [Streptomyces sp. NPDC050433]|uniref:ABC transporter ATP-binding protein n=1 Tax=Streptomyces sp. NPDC050433 TaxID=3365615 RepID=UPI00379FE04C
MLSKDRILLDSVSAAGRHGKAGLIVGVCGPVATLALPAALASALDAAIGARPAAHALTLVCLVLALATACEVAGEYLEITTKAYASLSLRRRITGHMLALGAPGRVRFDSGDVLGRTLESCTGAAGVTSSLVALVGGSITSVGGLVALVLIDPWLGAVALGGAPLMWWLTGWLMRRVGSLTSEYERAHSALASLLIDALKATRTIRANGTVDREIARVLTPLGELSARGHEYWEVQRKAAWRGGLVNPVLQIAVLAVAGHGVLAGRLTPGELLAAQAYLFHALGLLGQTALLARVAHARGSAARVAELLDTPPPPRGDRTLPTGPGTVTLRGVRVAGAGRAVLDGVDLTLPGGLTVALVGASGSGKSTLAEVVGGLRAPDTGSVALDGVPLAELGTEDRHRAVCYAFERPVLLGETLRDALSYGDGTCAAGRIEAALEACAAAGFVGRLPAGLDTPLGELRLSGGEMQRLGLARTAWRQVRLMVLDDVTSSVDMATEAEISGALRRVRRGTTRLIVTHRMSVAAGADLVAWLADGRVRALATHELLLADADYRAVFGAAGDGVVRKTTVHEGTRT